MSGSVTSGAGSSGSNVVERYDLAVVGAGPAGAMAAIAARREGRSVLLIEKAKFPRAKVCGCCISGAAATALRAAGVGEVLHDAVRLRRFAWAAGGRAVTLALHGSRVLSRAALDAALVERAREVGVRFVDGTRAELGPLKQDGRRLTLHGGAAGEDDATTEVGGVIVADGLGGRLLDGEPGFAARVAPAARLGLAAIFDAGRADERGLCERDVVRMACGQSGYVGMVRLEDGRLNVAAAVDRAAVREAGGPGPAVRRIVEEAGCDVGSLLEGDWRGTPPLRRRRERLAGRRLLVVGDAAGYVEPFTGEGIAWAVAAGAAAGAFAVAIPPQQWERRWPRRWARMIGGPQRRCGWVAAMLRRPTMVSLSVGMLERWPWLRGRVTRPIASPLKGTPA